MSNYMLYEMPQTIIEQDERQITADDLMLSRALRPFKKYPEDVLAGVWTLFANPESSLMSAVSQLMETEIMKKIKEGQTIAHADYDLMMDDDAIILPSSAAVVMDGFNQFLTLINDEDCFTLEQVTCKLASAEGGSIEPEIPVANCLHVSSLRTLILSLTHIFLESEGVQLQMMDTMLEQPLSIKDLKALEFLKKHFTAIFSPDMLVELNFNPNSKYKTLLGEDQLSHFTDQVKNCNSFEILKSINKFRAPLDVARYQQLSDALNKLESRFPGVKIVLYFYLFRSNVIDLYENAIKLSFDEHYTIYGARPCQIAASILLEEDSISYFDSQKQHEIVSNSDCTSSEVNKMRFPDDTDTVDDSTDELEQNEENSYNNDAKVYELYQTELLMMKEQEVKLIEEVSQSQILFDNAKKELEDLDKLLLLIPTLQRDNLSLLNSHLDRFKIRHDKKMKIDKKKQMLKQKLQRDKIALSDTINTIALSLARNDRRLTEIRIDRSMKEDLLTEVSNRMMKASPVTISVELSDMEVLHKVLLEDADYFNVTGDARRAWDAVKEMSSYARFINKQLMAIDVTNKGGSTGDFLVKTSAKIACSSEINRMIRMTGDLEWDERSKELSATFPPSMMDAYYQRIYANIDEDAKLIFIGGQRSIKMKNEFTKAGLSNNSMVYDNFDEESMEEVQLDNSVVFYDFLTDEMIYKASHDKLDYQKTWMSPMRAFDKVDVEKIHLLMKRYGKGVIKIPMPYHKASLITLVTLLEFATSLGKNPYLYPSNNPHEAWFYLKFSPQNVPRSSEFLLVRLLLSWAVGVIDRHKIYERMVGMNSQNWEECRVSHLYDIGFVPVESLNRVITYRYQSVYKSSGRTRTARKVKTHKMIKQMEELANKRSALGRIQLF
jgi:hypothetical protein